MAGSKAQQAEYAKRRTLVSRKTAASLEGMEELYEFFEELADEKTRLKVMSGAVRAGLATIAKDIKKLTNSATVDTPHGDDVRAAARKSVGFYYKRFPRKGGYTAKVGYGVGKRGAKRTELLSKGETGGAGIAAANIHWFVLGTKERVTKTGGRRGRMDAYFDGIVKEARAIASMQVVPEMLKRAKATLRRISAKRQRRLS